MDIIEKPWGHEVIVAKTPNYVVKRLFMKHGHRCSLQYHLIKTETVIVESGVLKVSLGPSNETLTEHELKAGDHLTIAAGMIHRMYGVSDCYYLECSTPELEDVVRLVDDYGR